MYMWDFPLLMTRLENSPCTGTNAPHTHNICIIGTLASHFPVTHTTISSRAMKASPSISGKETNAVKRNILRKTANCRALSPAT